MVLGTASHVGKSVTTAALCRLLRDDGVDVAPFKAQNMSLNSFATLDGLEIGRAQAMQAEAARLDPSVDMNPILLKPASDTSSQVVLNGRMIGTLSGAELFARRDELWHEVREAYSRLAQRHAVIIIEGAGSPVEMNLKHLDIVNLAMAEHARARCVLVADIDRGGVFAQIVGTYALLEPDEKARFVGFIVNRFRGDPTLLGDGVRFLEDRTGQPCLGVVPHLPAIGIPEEDSVVLEECATTGAPGLRVGVVLLPSLANFTDFDALARMDGVSFRYLREPRGIAHVDLVILPGSKNTVRDLAYLRTSGHAEAIQAHARAGKPILGICGGFQMLGREINDPHGVESGERRVEGLGLLDVVTTMASVKTTRQATARFLDDARFSEGARITGYEIHVGETERGRIEPLLLVERADDPVAIEDGAVTDDGCTLGTYLHGLFDEASGRLALVNHFRSVVGLTPLALQNASPIDPYERLAQHFRSHLDMAVIRRAIALRSVA
jgi:adenosylcobyric acid synthase